MAGTTPGVDGRARLRAVLQRTRGIYVAARVGVAVSTVSRWASGQRRPTASHRARLHECYGIPLESWGRA
jgi:transcriptional regulator with XRE-family HTH domain